jgi:PAS domain S-box-containing protein
MFRILYVDDEFGLLEIGKLFLERDGQFTVDIITSATDALSLMQSKTYDAVISDYQMPEMDGIQFLKQVRGSGNTVPFILFTGRGREEVVIQALNEGADFYLQKGGEPKPQFAELSHKVLQAILRKRAEESIRYHERREEDIINFLPDATFAIDTKGTVIAWNRAIEEMTGIPADRILGKGSYEYAIPFYGGRRPILADLIFLPADEIRDRYSHIVRDGTMIAAETSLPRIGGRQRTVWAKASLLYDQNGNVVGAIESIRDITERKTAEDTLRETEGRFAAFMDHLPVTAFIKDEQSTNLFVNRRMEEIFGAREWLGRSVYEQFPREAADKMVEDDRKTLRDGYRKTIENLYEKNGSLRIFETYKFRLDREKKPPLIGGFAMDITDKTKVENSLRESEEKYRELVENANSIILKWDRQGKITVFNEFAQHFFGYTEREIIGRSVMGTIVPATESGSDRDLSLLIDDIIRHPEDHGVNENENITRDGKRVWIRWQNKILLDENGEFSGLFSIGSDITERKLAEDALRASEERYRNVVEDQTEFISRFLPDGTHVFVNEAYCRYFGLERYRILGHRFKPAIPAGDQGRVKQFFDSFTPDHPVDTIEHRIIMPDGGIRWQRWSDRAIFDPSGTITEYQSVGRDITDRKLAEEVEKQEEAQLRQIIDLVPHMIFAKDWDGNYLLANRAVAEGYHTTVPELEGKTQATFHRDADELRQMLADDREVMTTSTTKFIPEEAYTYASGEEHFFQTTKVPFTLLGNNKPAVLGVAIDITERKRAGEDLRKSEEKYRNIVEATPGMIWEIDNTGNFIYISPQSEQYLGYPWEELIGRPFLSLVREDARESVIKTFRSHIPDKTTLTTLEVPSFHRNGTPIILEIRSIVILNETLQVTGFRGIATDITERKRAEVASRESEETFRMIFDTAQSALIILEITVDGLPCTMVDANTTACSQLGYTKDELLAKTFFSIDAEEFHEIIVNQINALATRKSGTYESVRIRKNGERFPVEVNIHRMMLNGREVIVSSARDITRWKQTEETLRRVNRKLNLLASITRHDLSNQTTVLQSFLALLEGKQRDPVHEKYLREADTAAKRISTVIRFTKEYESIGVNTPLWQDCSSLVDTAARQASLGQLTVKNDLPAGAEVFADPLIIRVFYNLMENAVRYGGKITLIRFSLKESGIDPIIVCEDDGEGVAAENKEQIFERGFGKNTGMGLFLSREILWITGITIRETGVFGSGARFEMTVPRSAYRSGKNPLRTKY